MARELPRPEPLRGLRAVTLLVVLLLGELALLGAALLAWRWTLDERAKRSANDAGSLAGRVGELEQLTRRFEERLKHVEWKLPQR